MIPIKKIILASGSRDRKQILELLKIPFEIIVSDYNEDKSIKLVPTDLSIFLANGKLNAVKDKIENDKKFSYLIDPGYIIIAADTIVSFNNTVIGKAKDKDDAFRILKSFSGEKHELITGTVLYDSESGQTVEFSDTTEVEFENLSDNEVLSYLNNSEEYKGRAGAYSLRERAGLFIKSINGSPSNVIGLPVDKIYQNLKNFGVNLLEINIKTELN